MNRKVRPPRIYKAFFIEIMKTELKKQLVDRLRSENVNLRKHYAIQKLMMKIMIENDPKLDFSDLEGTAGKRGKGFDLFLEHSGCNRVDFYLPNYESRYKNKPKPQWYKGEFSFPRYPHPTIESVLFYENPSIDQMSRDEIADIIEKYVVVID